MENKIKAVKQRAVQQFATQYNTKQHDKARLKNPPLHPNKWAKTQTLTIM